MLVPRQALVQAVAVLGSPASLDSARLLAGLEDPWPALKEAAMNGLLVEVAGSSYGEVAFTHPLAAVPRVTSISVVAVGAISTRKPWHSPPERRDCVTRWRQHGPSTRRLRLPPPSWRGRGGPPQF